MGNIDLWINNIITFMKKVFLASVIVVTIGIFFGLSTLQAYALTISPLRREVTAKPGETAEVSVRLTNEKDIPVVVTPLFREFVANQDGTGAAKFIEPKDLASDNVYVSRWMQAQRDRVVLRPKQTEYIKTIVSVPAQAAPGGYFGAILWESVPQNATNLDGPGVGLKEEIATLVLLTVPGNVERDIFLSSFKLEPDRTFHSRRPITFALDFENKGNIHLKPSGAVIVKNMIGWKSAEIAINPHGGNVLPRSHRVFSPQWASGRDVQESTGGLVASFITGIKNELSHFGFGRYTAQAFASFVPQGTRTNTVVFWIIPWRLLLITILAIAIIWKVNHQMNKRMVKKVMRSMKE